MSRGDVPERLRGRRRERGVLDTLVSEVAAGHSAVLVLRGEAGIGKSTLLDDLAAHVAHHRVTRGAGAESEMELAFAGLHQLCAPFLERADSLPPPQREALATAFGLSTGPPPDRFLVGLAVLGLLTEVAAEQPLFCLVDDAQWLDRVSAQTLAFVARRMLAGPLALVFATRERRGRDELAGLPELRVDGLDDADARALLSAAVEGPMDERIRDRILAEARGNPLALLELPRSLLVAEPADGPARTGLGPVAGHIERSCLARVRSLPEQMRRLLLVAAAEPIGDVTLLRRAARRLHLDPGAIASAVSAGLLTVTALVRFRHPLLRSAVYRSAGPAELRQAHQALAEVTDPSLDPDRRAWHLARATVRPDEAIAGELEASAGRALARGGTAAAAAFLAHAAVLTPHPGRKATRALAAARAKLRAGAPAAARDLVALARSGALDEPGRAHAALVQAQVAFASSRIDEALPLLLATARRLVPLDVALARETFLDALSAAMFAGRLASGADVREVAAALGTSPPPGRPRAADLLLDALATRFTGGFLDAVPVAREALAAFRRETDPQVVLRWSWPASVLAAELWDYEGWTELVARHVRTARGAGTLTELPLALDSRVVVHACAGELDAAALLVAEITRLQEAAGSSFAPYGTMTLSALQGSGPEAVPLIAASAEDAVQRGEGLGVAVARRAEAVLYNGLGRFEEAFTAAWAAGAQPQDPVAARWGLVELVEAGVRSGRHDAARAALEGLTPVTDAAGTDWAVGVQVRSRALLGRGTAAEDLYREAVERLGRTRVLVELARAHLLYGEWLRREGRRADAREQLREAHTLFTRFGARAFAERAVRELRAVGETVSRVDGVAEPKLTAQEARIARLARDGLTNSEIGARLFLSPHTVEWHLRKVYAKLGVASRRLLRTVL
ncbi:AAA family ATPase [Streptomyces sp. NPDC060275]|uniref:AAA family ATPase n=1 Tax=Streptomyces sp. NPDC060275 TaxID=3347090 RepID=UPI0036517B4B